MLPGAGRPTAAPLPAARFLALCERWAPGHTVSPGWTTGLAGPREDLRYTRNQVLEMAAALVEAGITGETTFPVRAAFVPASSAELRTLMGYNRQSTLTIWSSPGDPVSASGVADFIRGVGVDRVYLDVPADLDKEIQDRLHP